MAMSAERGTTGQETTSRRSGRLVMAIVGAMALVGVLSLGSMWWMSHRLGHSHSVPATAAYNAGPHHPLSAAEVPAALLSFRPANDSETVEAAILTATGQRLGAGGHFPGQVRVSAGPSGRWQVAVAVPVNLAYLEHIGAITTGPLPGASDLKTGQLEVSGTNHVYAVTMNPKTHVAVFRFQISRDDAFLWPRNWNAVGVVSQTDSLS